MSVDDSQPGDSSSQRKRRPRYSGTHPQSFEQRYKERDAQKYPEMQAHVRAQGRTPAGTHVPILVAEVLSALHPVPGEIVADVTLGYGGHAEAFLRAIGPAGKLIGLDLDGPQIEITARRLESLSVGAALQFHNSHFAGLPKILASAGIAGVDILFADLGLSSMQIDNPTRGFSYKHDGPLDMRMDARRPRRAADVLRTIAVDDLAAALRELADEPAADAIASAIVERRGQAPITTTRDLVDVVLAAQGLTHKAWRAAARSNEATLHPAARTFQARRILVNEEMHGLEQLLRVAPHCLNPGARLGILTFHSGEDRRVKSALEEGLESGSYASISGEPLRPSPAERRDNPRCAPAKFRWAVRSADARTAGL